MPSPQPAPRWYAHEYPDRPIVEGSVLCCCLLCARSLERAGQEDCKRPVALHTGYGVMVQSMSYVASHRTRAPFHQLLWWMGHGPGNWLIDVVAGPRTGRGAKGFGDRAYPRPFDAWPICTHCGPLSHVSCTTLSLVGEPRKRKGAKQLTAEQASRLARATLMQEVEEMLERQRAGWVHPHAAARRGLDAVPDAPEGGFDPKSWDDEEDHQW